MNILFSFSAFRSLGNEPGPNPCSFNRSCSLNFESLESVSIPSRSSALLAGAGILLKKPDPGLRSFSQIGQTGQSLLL